MQQPTNQSSALTHSLSSLDLEDRIALLDDPAALGTLMRLVWEKSDRAKGLILNKVKTLLAHGEWLPWLKQYWPLSEREAQRYMALVDNDSPALRDRVTPTSQSDTLSSSVSHLQRGGENSRLTIGQKTPRVEIVEHVPDDARPVSEDERLEPAPSYHCNHEQRLEVAATFVRDLMTEVNTGLKSAPQGHEQYCPAQAALLRVRDLYNQRKAENQQS